ncbi:hypothetical protein GS429_01590 [Natronorubrum sp. JWXQ-INN-674]|uniref:Uncharacterized protein n=1 Tax=Natronorubrum halalkaliphilum TaxID=2691917 RepID=A0A6B0VHE7_9EURY|nr:hypothetical protein [Natronorubrum halalkaliphilum]MXV60783.1 hypothetical protein [Natronorubrum halalkaliphilum]
MSEANYCGNCGFPIPDDPNEAEIRELAQGELSGFLDGYDVQSILDSMNGEQEPTEAYQWYLEEGVKKALTDLAILQRSDWFDKKPISGLFFQEEMFKENPTDEAMEDFILWARISAFFYEAFQPVGLELSIRMGAAFAEGLNPSDDIHVSITVEPDDEEEGLSGPAS